MVPVYTEFHLFPLPKNKTSETLFIRKLLVSLQPVSQGKAKFGKRKTECGG